MYFPARKFATYVCTRLLSYSKRHLRNLWDALFQCRVNFTPLFVSVSQTTVCDIPGANLQGSKTRNRQDIYADPQPVSAIVTCAVPGLSVFYSLIVFISQPWACAVWGAHLLGSIARIQRDIREDCFWSCKLRCCWADCVYSLVLTCSLIFLQL